MKGVFRFTKWKTKINYDPLIFLIAFISTHEVGGVKVR